MKTYFGFALADSMFTGDCTITRKELHVGEAQRIVKQGVESCCNPSHAATIDAARRRYMIDVPVPEVPPRVQLEERDSVLVMGVRGLPRLTDRHEYSAEEVLLATFSFALYTVEKSGEKVEHRPELGHLAYEEDKPNLPGRPPRLHIGPGGYRSVY